MVSDQEITKGVSSVLHPENPNAVTSVNGVVQQQLQQVDAKLGHDHLSHKTTTTATTTTFTREQQIDHHNILLPQSDPRSFPAAFYPRPHLFQSHLPSPHQHHPPQHLPNNYLHVLSVPPSSSSSSPPFPFHQHHEFDFRFPHQPPPVPSPSHFVVSAPSNVVFAASPTVAVAAVPAPDSSKESVPAGNKRRGGSGGLNKLCGVSPALQAIVGEPAMPRTQIVKQLWAYIRKNNLQDPSNKRKIICNDELRLVFETDCTDMFKMNKLLAKHIMPLEPNKNSGPETKRIKTEESGTAQIDQNQSPVIISDALANFFGAGEREMLPDEAVKRVCDYIKLNHLEDPLDSKVIRCDSKLQDLLGSECISVLAISELLVRHFFKHSENVIS